VNEGPDGEVRLAEQVSEKNEEESEGKWRGKWSSGKLLQGIERRRPGNRK